MNYNTYYGDIVKSSMEWISSECFGISDNKSIQLNYSPHSGFNYYIPNAASIALGYLSNINNVGLSYCKLEVDKIANAIISGQNKDGSWYYSEKSDVIDLLHTSYTLEGMWIYLKYNDNPELKKKVEKGTEYFLCNFLSLNGYGIKDYSYKLKDVGIVRFKRRVLKEGLFYVLNSFGFFEKRKSEARLWGYAAAIRMLCYATYTNPEYLLNAMIIFKHLQKNQDESGYFYYKTIDKSCYIRHQAHIFEALSILAKTIREQMV